MLMVRECWIFETPFYFIRWSMVALERDTFKLTKGNLMSEKNRTEMSMLQLAPHRNSRFCSIFVCYMVQAWSIHDTFMTHFRYKLWQYTVLPLYSKTSLLNFNEYCSWSLFQYVTSMIHFWCIHDTYVPTHLDSLAQFDSESKWARPKLTPFGPVWLCLLF